MAGVGEATAVWGALRIGFSIATVLTTYIADVREAKEDVRSLASELDSTLRHLEELDKLTDSNKQTKGWSENGEKLAENCKQDSIKVVNQLMTLLENSGNSVQISPDKDFKREDIDLTIFHKASWPVYKPQVEIVKKELQSIKMNILLARDVYKASAGTTQIEKDGARRRLAALSRGQVDALRMLRQAQHEGNRVSHRPREVRFGESPVTSVVDNDPAALEDWKVEEDYNEYDKLYVEIEEDVQRQRARADREARAKVEEVERLKAAAVEEYKKALLDAIAQNKRDADESTSKLKEYFEDVPPARIQDYVQAQAQAQVKDQELKQLSELFQQMTATSASKHAFEVAPRYEPLPLLHRTVLILQSTLDTTKWTRKSRWPRRTASDAIPAALLRTELHPDCARVLSLMVKLDGERNVVEPIHISLPWLIDLMRREESESLGVTQTMKTWEVLPAECHVATRDWFRKNSYHAGSWSLVFARTSAVQSPNEGRKRRFPYWHRRRQTDVVKGTDSSNRNQDFKGVDKPIAATSILLVFRHSRPLEGVVRVANDATGIKKSEDRDAPNVLDEILLASNIESVEQAAGPNLVSPVGAKTMRDAVPPDEGINIDAAGKQYDAYKPPPPPPPPAQPSMWYPPAPVWDGSSWDPRTQPHPATSTQPNQYPRAPTSIPFPGVPSMPVNVARHPMQLVHSNTDYGQYPVSPFRVQHMEFGSPNPFSSAAYPGPNPISDPPHFQLNSHHAPWSPAYPLAKDLDPWPSDPWTRPVPSGPTRQPPRSSTTVHDDYPGRHSNGRREVPQAPTMLAPEVDKYGYPTNGRNPLTMNDGSSDSGWNVFKSRKPRPRFESQMGHTSAKSTAAADPQARRPRSPGSTGRYADDATEWKGPRTVPGRRRENNTEHRAEQNLERRFVIVPRSRSVRSTRTEDKAQARQAASERDDDALSAKMLLTYGFDEHNSTIAAEASVNGSDAASSASCQ
ncbi:hypothetical protein AMS68_000244 [Peltaster fructicola]|uniref:Fungal N-terminal domain-containing protein n=1 Tax=Peltaster fructicola TaxID=286661 RepID=A0A6H0XJ22_9PEZI|nr:hypothetical protein AMS68_000244 [Peltaster fructicola]